MEVINNNSFLLNIKSKYILKKIFTYIKQNTIMKIIQYNKKLQNKLNIVLYDYKIEYHKIIIELTPAEKLYGKFINILTKTYKDFCHIYFNDNKKEIKRNYINQYDKVVKIKIILDYPIKCLNILFKGCKCIKKINFIKFKRNDIKNMSCMFRACSSLEEINLSNFNTDNVTNMNGIFMGCSSLKKIDLSNFNTEYVKYMKNLFCRCSSLEDMDLSNFDTENVTNMSGMFMGCSSLKKIDLSNFNTENVEYMDRIFHNCRTIKRINLSSFNTDSVIDMYSMFCFCESLKELELSNFNINNTKTIGRMFCGCLKELKEKIKRDFPNLEYKRIFEYWYF